MEFQLVINKKSKNYHVLLEENDGFFKIINKQDKVLELPSDFFENEIVDVSSVNLSDFNVSLNHIDIANYYFNSFVSDLKSATKTTELECGAEKTQLHGKKFEEYIKQGFNYSVAVKKHTDFWDIDAIDDHDNFPTSVKTTWLTNKILCMADARRFFEISEDFRLLIGFYKQTRDKKVFKEIHEYLIPVSALNSLRGSLSYRDVKYFHDEISSFGAGEENQKKAQQRALEVKQELKEKLEESAITLNPKIDSQNQRRLQCSINLEMLSKLVKPKVYKDYYRGIAVEIQIESQRRKIS